MKKKIQFEQIENIVSEKMAEEGYVKAENMSLGKRLSAGIFFAGCIQVIYWFGFFLVGNPEFSGINNEYQFIQSIKWVVMLFSIYYLFCMIFLGGKYRRKDNIKLAYKSNVWLLQLSILFYLLLIIDLQLLTVSPYMRVVNILVVIACFIYSIIKSIKKIENLIYTDQQMDQFTTFMIEKQKLIQSILLVLFIGSAIVNIFLNTGTDQIPKQNLEGKIILSLIPALPILFSILSIYAFSWMFEMMTRIYFLNTFSEKFRLKFNVTNKLWYGSKSKEYKEEQSII
ncbi:MULTISPECIES: hypothetical protein [unclassified Enterococcus]|uniref:hypothetical protein n=1 Tax=unclassified Enterococcus TaxID=2608891 RepID=UPI001CE10ADB|nr:MULTISPECIES: hypothetical protein [unclassified Enterococcus]MCA5014308.1 hypothetical protein [Enterococcus sp. S23]MCA5017719.1 hypothetical protein [Enterococcus sp. S22(2020)]